MTDIGEQEVRIEPGLIRSADVQEREKVAEMYKSLEDACKGSGIGNDWKEIEECLKMVDASMSKVNEKGVRVRKRRKNNDLDLSHPVAVAIKTIEIARKYPKMVALNAELIEAAVLHDFFEDFEMAVGVFNLWYPGDKNRAAKVMGIALDVTKAIKTDRRVDSDTDSTYSLRTKVYGKLIDSDTKFRIKDIEDDALLKNVIDRAMAGDNRPLVIKIADRLHNLETVGGLKPDAKNRTIRQTRKEFVPLARRFGLIAEADEMERLCKAAE